MTDLPGLEPTSGATLEALGIDLDQLPVPSRLGTSITVEGGMVRGHLVPRPATTVHGVVRASVIAFLVDVVAGLTVDVDPDAWAFTSDLSLRLPPVAAPARIDGVCVPLRAGRRSVTAEVRMTGPDGSPFGHAVIGFARVERRPGDPEKPHLDHARIGEMWGRIPPIDAPVRAVAGVLPVEPAAGMIELAVRDNLRNPAGALQGAMVALAFESAVEDVATHHLGGRQVVTDLDIRYLHQARVGPVRTRARFVGDPSAASMVVDLLDAGRDDALVATAYARTQPAG